MTLTHFGLSREPFSIAPDPHYLFMSPRHREALAHLLFGVHGVGGAAPSGGFVLLTGDIGTGKTTVCRCFLAQVPAGCQVAYIFNPKLTVPELLQTIGEEFHLWTPATDPATGAATGAATSPALAPGTGGHMPSPKAAMDALNAFLLRSHAAGQQCVLVIDEAQHLSTEVLEQLRLLTNLETNERKLLQIVLIGQPELREMLARPELEQLAQRVVARFHLDALTETETSQYIAHRLQVAGLSGPVPLEPQAIQRIHQLSGGVPRRINLLCGRALLGAWTLGQTRVDLPVVEQAAREVFGDAPPPPALERGRWQRAGWLGAGAALGVLAAVGAVALALRTTDGASAPSPISLSPDAPPVAEAGPPLPPTASTLAAAPGDNRDHSDLAPLLAQWPTELDAAWPELARLWPTTGTDTGKGTDCSQLQAQGHSCYRSTRMTLPLLRQLDRPAVLALTAPGKPATPAHQVVLVGLGDRSATLSWQGRRHTVPLVALVQAWNGDFATLWQPPPGFGERLLPGASGPAVGNLSQWLNTLDGLGSADPPVLDDKLEARVRAFQLAHGLAPDGRPGPMTFMQLERASGALSVRLSTPTATPPER
jgi:general secretion pathway protein A